HEQGESLRGDLQAGLPGEFFDRDPIDVAQVHSDRNPSPRPYIRGNEKLLGVLANQATLLAEAGSARKGDLAVIVVVEKVVRENLPTHFERDVFFAQVIGFDFGKRRTQFEQPILATSRGSHLLSGQSHCAFSLDYEPLRAIRKEALALVHI